MSNLYIITGTAGVGKSTISRRIAESKNKSTLYLAKRKNKFFNIKSVSLI